MRLKLPGALVGRIALRRQQAFCLPLHRVAPAGVAPAAEARSVRRQHSHHTSTFNPSHHVRLIMEEPKPITKVAFGILGTLSLVFGFVATLLGAAAWFLSHQRTGTEGLAVITAVFFQWVAALVGGYILGVPALRQRSRAARLGVFLSVASVVVTALALIRHYV
jgi:hypothetical protein